MLTALEQAPRSADAHGAMAYFLEKTGQMDEAEVQYLSAIHLSNAPGPQYNNYGAFLCRTGKFKQAQMQFEAAVGEPSYLVAAEAYENAGLCALQVKQSTKAESYFKHALKRDPRRASSMLELADIEYKKGKTKQADQHLKHYASNAIPTARSTWLAVRIAHRLGQKDRQASNAMYLKANFPNTKEVQQLKAFERS